MSTKGRIAIESSLAGLSANIGAALTAEQVEREAQHKQAIRNILAAKDAEIAELRKIIEHRDQMLESVSAAAKTYEEDRNRNAQELAHSRELIRKANAENGSVHAELAAVTKERDQWKHDAQKRSRWVTDLVKSRGELLSKIQSAPKIWFNLISGSYSAGEPFDLEECRACWTRVYAVPAGELEGDISTSRIEELERELAAARAEVEQLSQDRYREQCEREKWERLAMEFQSQRNEFEVDNDKLRAELAAVRVENEQMEDTFHILRNSYRGTMEQARQNAIQAEHYANQRNAAEQQLAELRERIEAAPKVYLWWRQDMHGNWFIKAAETDHTRWSGRTFCEGDRVEEVHAVPVDGNEKDEGA